MKNLSILTLIQALLSLVSGILISKMSFIGKIGVSTFYSQYAVFKTWWKTALKVMKFSFHAGFYLFWITWFITCFYFLLSKGAKQTTDLPEEAS